MPTALASDSLNPMSTENTNLSRNMCVVIPARNESASIATVIKGLKVAQPEASIVVVDDHSSDRTSQIAMQEGVIVLRHPFCLGAWCAMQTGIRYARQKRFEKLLTMDGDGQHLPSMVSLLLGRMNETGSNVVIGEAPSRGSTARKIAWNIFRRLFDVGVKDVTSGFRLYDASAIKVLARPSATYLEYQDAGVLALLLRNGLKVSSVRVEMSDRAHGKSRIFNSWLSVALYMSHTLLLGLANKRRRAPSTLDGEKE